MSASSLSISQPRTALLSRAADFLELTKPRIAVLELVVVLAAGFVATHGQPDPGLLLAAMLGTALVAASASAANQWLERRSDALMARTASRPLAAGRMTGGEALAFAGLMLAAGILQLSLFVNLACAGWALGTWAMYVLAYTPLKTRSVLNTAVGAVAGAMPVLIGWSASGASLDLRAASLFLVLFLWQFPHFMAIAWLYREDYAAAGQQMMTVVDPSGRRAGQQAVLNAFVVIPVSLVPVLAAPGLGSLLYAAGALTLGIAQLIFAIHFSRSPGDGPARRLLKASLVYLPTLLVMLMLSPLI